MSGNPPTSSSPVTPVAVREGDYFNGLISDHGDFNPFADRGWKNLGRRFERYVNLSKPVELLDVGCGTGQSRQLYINHVARYVGIDLSEEGLRLARKKFPDSTWELADACKLPFADASFDVVAFSSVLHHIPDYPLALGEAIRVLRPGGQAFAFDPNLLHPAMALFRHPKSPLYSSNGVSPNERPLLPSSLRDAFKNAGFVDLIQSGMADLPYRAVAPKLINACLGIYNVGDWFMERVGLGKWFGPFVITCGTKAPASV